jgi:hypothetical protein
MEQQEALQIRARKEVLEFLLKSAGWGLLDEYLKDQVKYRESDLMQLPVRNLEEMAAFNYQRGIKDGLILALAIPVSMLEEAQMKWQELLEEHRDEHGG